MELKKLVFILALTVLVVTVGCDGGNATDEGPSAEVLTLSEDCRDSSSDEREQCCRERCAQFCSEKGYEMDKIKTFPTNCGCWCSETQG